MAKEITVQLSCVQMRSGVEIWLEAKRIEKLREILSKLTGTMFIDVGDEVVNTADIVGIFTAGTMEENKRRKNGQWKCNSGTWHDRGEKCACLPPKDKARAAARALAIKNCGKCNNGFIEVENEGVKAVRQHECVTKALKNVV